MIKVKIRRKLIIFLFLFFSLVGTGVQALEINYPNLPGVESPQEFINTALPEDFLPLYVKYFLNLFLWIGGIIAMGSLVYAGALFIFSKGSPEKIVSARSQVSGALFGLLLLFSSFLILNTISPQFINFKIEKLEVIVMPELPEISVPETLALNTTIDVEMPFGRIIEKIFEMYIAEHPSPDPLGDPRMLRVKNISRAIIGVDGDQGLADRILSESQNLKNYADRCTCHTTTPVNPCGNRSGFRLGLRTRWKCNCDGCSATLPVTCDPCEDVRSNITNSHEENKNTIYRGTDIVQFDLLNNKVTINTSLRGEQIKIEEEILSLTEWLNRLKRAEKFILECPIRARNSLAQFYSKKDSYAKEGGIIRETKFWNDLSHVYYNAPRDRVESDFATFYCGISGSIEQKESYVDFGTGGLTGLESVEEAELVLSDSMACSKESPVGEIIDRTKRTSQLLIDKLGQLNGKIKELIDAVDELQVFVSQCSSQRGCERRCTCFSCGCDTGCSCTDKCEGWAVGCADLSLAYPSICLPRDTDTPCPYKEINDQLGEVRRIYREISEIIDGRGGRSTPSDIGIMQIIEEVATAILSDLELNVRKSMNECGVNLFSSPQLLEAIIPPDNLAVKEVCYTETLNPNTNKIEQNEYGDCFESCYLEIGEENHRRCVNGCLVSSGGDLNLCTHGLNFYCCP